MGHHRRFGCLFVVALVLTSCGGGSDRAEPERSATTSTLASPEARYELPFGLEQVDGTSPIGRPAIHERPQIVYAGTPVPSRTLEVLYRVDGADPVEVFDRWVDQIRSLHAGDVTVGRGDASGVEIPEDLLVEQGPQPWLVARGSGSGGGRPSGDWVDLQLWPTSGGPLLFARVDHFGTGGTASMIHDDVVDTAPPAVPVEGVDRRAGDVLFREQGDTVHLPEATRALSVTLPIRGGTGGSFTVLAAEDGATAVRALLAEAAAADAEGIVTEPETSTVAGATVILASFVIPAGGWGFEVASVRGPDDDAATVYVRSYAD